MTGSALKFTVGQRDPNSFFVLTSAAPADPDRVPVAVLAYWRRFAEAPSRRVQDGLINQTFIVEAATGERAVFQCLHPIFEPQVNLDIAALTERLTGQGLRTPLLLPADDGALWVSHDGLVWRAQSYVDGRSHRKLSDPRMAHQAGALVGRFHAAIWNWQHRYHFTRSSVHDTEAHLGSLRDLLAQHAAHSLMNEITPLAEAILGAADGLPDLGTLPARHSHGDLKVSNILFDDSRRAICLMDLDTLAKMPWPLEMGDALRSWCNPREEDVSSASLELELLDAALEGYAQTRPAEIGKEEYEALIPGLAQICLELSSRFLADVMDDRYFGWDATRYPNRAAHNLARARSMWALYQSVETQMEAAQQIVRARLL